MSRSMKDYPSVSYFNKPLGQILVEAGLISMSQIELALKEQKQTNLKIGEILTLHGWIKQETADFFAEEWKGLLLEQQKKPLIYYFQKAALLDQKQINELIRLQNLKQKKVRFHNLAVEQKYLKQVTVDFFVTNLFCIDNPNPLTKPYEILRDYAMEKKDFPKSNLYKALLVGVNLAGINLNGSNLRKANLKGSNLTKSSLIRANLSLTDLSKSILTEVNLRKSILNQANLREAHLEKTNFQGASLKQADLTKAYLSQADFSAADLREAKLPSEYSYEVYYDENTQLDSDINPKQMGWTKK